jgi:hypothetical protein
MEPATMLQAALVIVYFYQQLAPPLAQVHAFQYPADLQRVVSDRLEQACHAHLNGKQQALTYRHSMLLAERSGEVAKCALKVSLSP